MKSRVLVAIIVVGTACFVTGVLLFRPAVPVGPRIPSEAAGGPRPLPEPPLAGAPAPPGGPSYTAAAKTLMAVRAEHEREAMHLRTLPADQRTKGLLPLIERYSAVYQSAVGEPLVQFEALRSLVGLYTTAGDPAAAAAANARLLSLAPHIAAAGVDGGGAIELFTINGLEVLAEAALVAREDPIAGERLVTYARSTPGLFAVADLALLQGASEKAYVALGVRQLTADQVHLSRQMVMTLVGRKAAESVPPALDHWITFAVTAAARCHDQAAITELVAIAEAHPDRLQRGASYYSLLPWALDGWEQAYRSREFMAAALLRLQSSPADAFTSELKLHLAEAEIRSGDYPAAARRLSDLDQTEAFDPADPALLPLRQQQLFALGEALYRMGHRPQAQAHWDHFIRIADPGDPRLQLLQSIRGSR